MSLPSSSRRCTRASCTQQARARPLAAGNLRSFSDPPFAVTSRGPLIAGFMLYVALFGDATLFVPSVCFGLSVCFVVAATVIPKSLSVKLLAALLFFLAHTVQTMLNGALPDYRAGAALRGCPWATPTRAQAAPATLSLGVLVPVDVACPVANNSDRLVMDAAAAKGACATAHARILCNTILVFVMDVQARIPRMTESCKCNSETRTLSCGDPHTDPNGTVRSA